MREGIGDVKVVRRAVSPTGNKRFRMGRAHDQMAARLHAHSSEPYQRERVRSAKNEARKAVVVREKERLLPFFWANSSQRSETFREWARAAGGVHIIVFRLPSDKVLLCRYRKLNTYNKLYMKHE